MTMHVEVRINADTVCAIEVTNLTEMTGDDDVNTYQWRYPSVQAVHNAVGYVEHRYGDGAIMLAHNVLGQIADRCRVATLAARCDGDG